MVAPENLGFARANNLALREAKGELALLLNNDTLVKPGAIDTMLRVMKERPDVGILGPLLLNEDGSVQISYGGMISIHAELLQKFLRAGYARGSWWARRYVEGRAGRVAYPDWVSGACLMVRADVLAEVGLLDENFFMYTEEVDLCQRIRAQGFRIMYTPEAEVVHLGGKSTEFNREGAAYEYRRSQLYFYLKHYGRARLRLLKAYLILKIGAGWAVGSSRRRALNRRLMRMVWEF
jgi:hypothetical protein